MTTTLTKVKPKEVLSNTPKWPLGPALYENPLCSQGDIDRFHLEGDAKLTFPEDRLRMESEESTFVFWCPEEFPDNVCFSWNFWPVREPGLCMFFFATLSREGGNIFHPGLAQRTGGYSQYHHGDINTLHLSYFRRKRPAERSLNTCNLRKSHGFHLVAQGADPIPTVADTDPPYRIRLWKAGPRVVFAVNDLAVLDWTDDGTSCGPVLENGWIGFRQMAPMVAEYANFSVHPIQSFD